MDEIEVAPLHWGYDHYAKIWYGNTHGTGFPGYIVRGNIWKRRGWEGTTYICENEEDAKAGAEADWKWRVRIAVNGAERVQCEDQTGSVPASGRPM